jgi:hypothetical protein
MVASFVEVNSKLSLSLSVKLHRYVVPAVGAEEDVELQHSVPDDLVGRYVTL